ncbi:response regulator transcription factor [Streptomyces anulatus]|uniref:response regulator transcription factor n=1 Tax=Streptomyces anulatus TaxID=1892 RepID=UPI002E31B559|nr:response regulator transcription factor [Streptomyces anulatus]
MTAPAPAPSDGRVAVEVASADPLSREGVIAHLRPRPEVQLLAGNEQTEARVVVLIADALDDKVRVHLRQASRTNARTVLVTASIDEHQLVDAAECGVSGVIRRTEVSPERLVQAITAVARGGGHLPGDLLDQLLVAVGKAHNDLLRPHGLHVATLTPREVDVLRLLANGDDTVDVARKLSISERAVKRNVHAVMSRLQLRNRTHAVAYAMRQGLI